MYDSHGYKWSKSFMYKIAYYNITSDKKAAKKKKKPIPNIQQKRI